MVNSSTIDSIEKRLQRMLERKQRAMQDEKERLDNLERNIKYLAKKLGIKLT